MVLLNSSQEELYNRIVTADGTLNFALEDLTLHKHNDPTFYSDLLYLLCTISISNKEAEETYRAICKHRETMEAALGHGVDLRVALMDYFVSIKPRLHSPMIVEIHEYQEQVARALVDGLTGLLNRVTIEQLLGSEFARASRHKQSFSIMFLDIDNFKAINDVHGHTVGDLVLRGFSTFIKSQIRNEDYAGRWGGEEFVLLLPQTGRIGMEKLARRLLSGIKQRAFVEGLNVTFSAGCAEFPVDALGSHQLLAIADERMYYAKKNGKNRICLGEHLGTPLLLEDHPSVGIAHML